MTRDLDKLYVPQDGDPVEMIEAYASVKEDLMRLQALDDAGVDNWEGIDFAQELLRAMEEES